MRKNRKERVLVYRLFIKQHTESGTKNIDTYYRIRYNWKRGEKVEKNIIKLKHAKGVQK